MTTLSRRAMINLGFAGPTSAPVRHAAAIQIVPEGTETKRFAMAAATTAFMGRYTVPGLSVAIARAGRLVYTAAFGVAGREAGEALTP
jgi:CubicO group peptidase (beta-lactamase class C family)